MSNLVVGVDPSLTATGIATADGVEVVKVKVTGMERLSRIGTAIMEATDVSTATTVECRTHVFIEGYAYGRPNQAHQLGELGGVIRYRLWLNHVPYTDVPPSSLKSFAAGKGNARKPDMLDAARREGYDGSNDDNAVDAWWLRQFGLAVLGDHVDAEMFAYRVAAVVKFAAVEVA